MDSNDKKYSMDMAFLENINICIRKFFTAAIDGNDDWMLNIVEVFEIYISPTVDTSKAKTNLKWLDDNFTKAFVYDEHGQQIGYNPKNRRIVQKTIKETMRLLLEALERGGIYTKKIVKVEQLMGKFSSC